MSPHLPQERLWFFTDNPVEIGFPDSSWYSVERSTPPENLMLFVVNNMSSGHGRHPLVWLQETGERREKPDAKDKRPRLLVVDDEVDHCATIKDAFSPFMQVLTATSVSEAIRNYDLRSVAVAIIDWHIPGESGIVLARMLRSFMPEECILLHSADDTAAKYESGSFRFVPKNIEPEELERLVEAGLAARVKPSKFA